MQAVVGCSKVAGLLAGAVLVPWLLLLQGSGLSDLDKAQTMLMLELAAGQCSKSSLGSNHSSSINHHPPRPRHMHKLVTGSQATSSCSSSQATSTSNGAVSITWPTSQACSQHQNNRQCAPGPGCVSERPVPTPLGSLSITTPTLQLDFSVLAVVSEQGTILPHGLVAIIPKMGHRPMAVAAGGYSQARALTPPGV